MVDTKTYQDSESRRPSFVSRWLEGDSDIRDLLAGADRSSFSSSRTSTSHSSFTLEEEKIPPPPEPVRESSAHSQAWDMISTDSLSPDEIQAILIALAAADHAQATSPEEPTAVSLPATCPRNVSVQQLPSVGGPEFLVTINNNCDDTRAPQLEDDIQWLTGEIAKPTAATRQYSIQPVQSSRQSPENGSKGEQPIITRQASVQPLPSRENTEGSSYWVTLPSTSAAIWKVNKNPDPIVRQVSLSRRRPSGSRRPSKLSFFRPTSRMNGKDLAYRYVVGAPTR